MPIDLEFVFDGTGVIYCCDGQLTPQHFFDANDRVLASPDRLAKLRFAIIDLTSMKPLAFGPADMDRIVWQDRHIASYLPSGLIVALVSPQDIGFGLARMWEASIEGLDWETMAFRSRQEADAWIRAQLKAKHRLDLT